jgi:hypothetical protein
MNDNLWIYTLSLVGYMQAMPFRLLVVSTAVNLVLVAIKFFYYGQRW